VKILEELLSGIVLRHQFKLSQLTWFRYELSSDLAHAEIYGTSHHLLPSVMYGISFVDFELFGKLRQKNRNLSNFGSF